MLNKLIWYSLYALLVVLIFLLLIVAVEFTDEKNERYFNKYNDPLGVAILLVVTSCSSVKFGWDPECQCQIKKEF